MTLSLVTLVTSPGKWLRADSANGTDDGLAARFAANRASAAPSTRRRPPGVRAAGSCPPSIQRLTVSELTPSSSAAWPTVNVGTAQDSIWHLPVFATDPRADEAKIGRQPRGCVSSYCRRCDRFLDIAQPEGGAKSSSWMLSGSRNTRTAP